MNNIEATKLVREIHDLLTERTENPQEGAIVVANLLAYMYQHYVSESSPLDVVLYDFCAAVRSVVDANKPKVLGPDGAPLQ